jgi:hypothetical protein
VFVDSPGGDRRHRTLGGVGVSNQTTGEALEIHQATLAAQRLGVEDATQSDDTSLERRPREGLGGVDGHHADGFIPRENGVVECLRTGRFELYGHRCVRDENGIRQ